MWDRPRFDSCFWGPVQVPSSVGLHILFPFPSRASRPGRPNDQGWADGKVGLTGPQVICLS